MFVGVVAVDTNILDMNVHNVHVPNRNVSKGNDLHIPKNRNVSKGNVVMHLLTNNMNIMNMYSINIQTQIFCSLLLHLVNYT